MNPRLLPDVLLPAYSFVPGRFPHPFSAPFGHRFHEENSDPMVLGCELFNQGYYWEAHEVWERCWIKAGRTGERADLFKALIHLAAAGVKIREGRQQGVIDHGRRAEVLLQAMNADEVEGWKIAELIELSRIVAEQPILPPDREIQPVERVFTFALVPNQG